LGRESLKELHFPISFESLVFGLQIFYSLKVSIPTPAILTWLQSFDYDRVHRGDDDIIILQRPKPISDARSHRGRDAKRFPVCSR
jgi:hypothetical protein